MVWQMMIVAALAAFLTAVLAGCDSARKLRAVDRMLDEVLDGRKVSYPDIREGELSAIAGKLVRIQEKMEVELEKAQEEKEQVKSLISNMSHQLKTPLANVCMYRELLESEENRDRQETFHRKMEKQLENITWILGSLFKMVKLEQGVIEFESRPASLKETIAAAVGTVLSKAEKKNVGIRTEPFADCLVCHNSRWTEEVFVNILENAVKYTDCGGRVFLSVHRMELFTEIKIEDDGIGIRKEELADIFRRFYRSRDVENREGSGIGLYLSRLILEKEKGYMTVKSEYGQGSCFSVFLQNA